jgi:hypothetical protein
MFYVAENDHVRRLVSEALFYADHLVSGLADHPSKGVPARAPGRRRA